MAIIKLEKFLLRAASVMAVTSFVKFCASRKRGTGAHSLVSLLIMMAVPTPQFGWQPQESEPHWDSLPLAMSAKPAKGLLKEMGNQSRVGGIFPTWLGCPLLRLAESVVTHAGQSQPLPDWVPTLLYNTIYSF